MMEQSDKIDFVILWVDPSDPKWIAQFNEHSNTKIGEKDAERFRDWGLLKYLFRGIDKYAPWVNNIYFVTCGQKPEWMDCDNPKLKLINHSDYIDEKYLPLFNASAIELLLHKLPDLSEHFVYFNDDMIILDKLKKNMFFKNNLPCDMPIESFYKTLHDGFTRIVFNDIAYLNYTFDKRTVIKNNFSKWYSLKYGKYLFQNLYFSGFKYFTSFKIFHNPQAFLRSDFEEAFNTYGDELLSRTMTTFRTDNNTNQYLMRYWQLVKGHFYPKNISKFNRLVEMTDDSFDSILDMINKQRINILCINDSNKITSIEKKKEKLTQSLEKLYPNKSSFEL